MEAKNNFVLIEPYNRNDIFYEEIKKRSGLLVKPKYQGAPDRGWVRSISKSINNPLYKVGDLVLFKQDVPDGFHYEGVGYLPVEHKNILAVLGGL